jgi:hypothetical protein
MREAAERALRAHCGPHLPFSVLGHAPLTFYKYKYPRRYRESSQRQGAKAGLRIHILCMRTLIHHFHQKKIIKPGLDFLAKNDAFLQCT